VSDPREKAIDQLERDLERDDLTPAERTELHREIRDIERDAAEEERWRDEGRERGWA
jgi:hypothetical protein